MFGYKLPSCICRKCVHCLTLLFMTCPYDSSHGKSQVPFFLFFFFDNPLLVTINNQDDSNIFRKNCGLPSLPVYIVYMVVNRITKLYAVGVHYVFTLLNVVIWTMIEG